jgi:hypothetical protein
MVLIEEIVVSRVRAGLERTSSDFGSRIAEQSDAHGAADRAVFQWRVFLGDPVIPAVRLPTAQFPVQLSSVITE